MVGYEVIRHQRGTENGYCDFTAKQIAVRPDVSAAQAVKTLIHELDHALLHAEGPVASREIAEVEVESIAFIVCDALGLDGGGYSFPYVTRWAEGSAALVKETAERAITCAKEMLTALETPAELEHASSRDGAGSEATDAHRSASPAAVVCGRHVRPAAPSRNRTLCVRTDTRSFSLGCAATSVGDVLTGLGQPR